MRIEGKLPHEIAQIDEPHYQIFNKEKTYVPHWSCDAQLAIRYHADQDILYKDGLIHYRDAIDIEIKKLIEEKGEITSFDIYSYHYEAAITASKNSMGKIKQLPSSAVQLYAGIIVFNTMQMCFPKSYYPGRIIARGAETFNNLTMDPLTGYAIRTTVDASLFGVSYGAFKMAKNTVNRGGAPIPKAIAWSALRLSRVGIFGSAASQIENFASMVRARSNNPNINPLHLTK